MSRHTPLLLLFLVFAFIASLSGIWAAKNSSQNASAELTQQHQSSLGVIALHNIAPFLISDNRLAIQAELDMLVAQTDLAYASVSGPSAQLIAASGQKSSSGQEATYTPIEITGEAAGVLQLQFEQSSTQTGSSFGQNIVIALATSVFLCILVVLLLLRENRKLNTLSEHLNLLLNYKPESGNGFDKLNESIWFLSNQLGGDHSKEDEAAQGAGSANLEKHLIALISTVQLSEWHRNLNRDEFDAALLHFEERLRSMLALYRGELLVVDDHRMVIDFGAPSPRQIRQAVVFSIGAIQSLAAHSSPVEENPLPLTAGLVALPSQSGLLSFMQCNHSTLDAHSEAIQHLSAGELLVNAELVDPSLDQLIDSATATSDGALIDAIKPSVLKLWDNQYHHRVKQT